MHTDNYMKGNADVKQIHVSYHWATACLDKITETRHAA